MKSFLVLFVAVGLASASETTVKKLTVFGVPLLPTWDTTDSIFGLRSVYANNYPFSLNPFTPFNTFPVVPNLLRSDMHSIPISLRSIFHKPIMMVTKSKVGTEGMDVYMLEDGLSSLADNPKTRFIHDMIKTGTEKTAVVIHPAMLHNTPVFKILKDMPITKIDVPTSIKFGRFVNTVGTNMPYVFIHDKEDVNTLDIEGLIRVGSLDITEEKILCPSCF